MRHTKQQLHAMIGAETLPVSALEQIRRASDELGATGGFRKIAEVVGQAHPRPEGLLTSELTKTECVWYRYVVDRKYESFEYRDGRRRRVTRTETLAEYTSSDAGYVVLDEEGQTIGVDPAGPKPDKPEMALDRFERNQGRQVDLFGINLPNPLGGNGSTIGFQYREWLIRPGTRLYILGEVHDKIGPLVIGKPEQDGYFIISTRSESELRAARLKWHRALAIGVIVLAVLGLGFLVSGFVT